MKRAVVDQPGLKVIFFGLLISIFCGLVIRSQITDAKIQERVKVIFQNIEKQNEKQQLELEFESAQLLLSEWGFPFPRLWIKNIKISSRKNTCMGNQIFIETLDIPLRWRNLLRLKTQIDLLRVGTMELRLNDLPGCLSETKSASSQNSRDPSSQSGLLRTVAVDVTTAESSSENRGNDLDIYIEKLKIIDKRNYNIPVLFQTLAARINYIPQSILAADVRSQLYLFKGLEQSIYRLRSDFTLNYVKDKQASIKIRGKLIDKSFEINADLDYAGNKVALNHKMNDLSLKSLLGLATQDNPENTLTKNLEGISGFAFSNQGHGEYNLKTKALEFYNFKEVVVSSGNSKIYAPEIDITSLQPLTFKPFKVSLDQFDLEKIKNLPAFAPIQKSVSSFGVLTGTAQIETPQKISVGGYIENILVIFSNQGQRVEQKIDNVNFKTDFKNLLLEGIVLEAQPVEGQIKTSFEPFNLTTSLSGIKLNDDVYRIFSFDKVRPGQFSLKAEVHNNQVKSKITIDQLASDFVELKDIEIGYHADISVANTYVYDLTFKNFKVNRTDKVDASFYTVLDLIAGGTTGSSTDTPAGFTFDTVKAHYQKFHPYGIEAQLSAVYAAAPKGEKNNIYMKSIFKEAVGVRPVEAVFNVDVLNRGRASKKFNFRVNLNHFTFEVLKN